MTDQLKVDVHMKVDVNSFIQPYEDSLTPKERRWKLYQSKQFRSIFEEYDRFTDRNIYAEDKEFFDNIIYIHKAYIPEGAAIALDIENISDSTLDSFGPEYTFLYEEKRGSEIIFNHTEKFKTIYAGRHWNNLTGLLYSTLHRYAFTSKEFETLFIENSDSSKTLFDWYTVRETLASKEETLKIFKTYFNTIFKDLHSHYVRYILSQKDDIMRHEGIIYLIPALKDILSDELIYEINSIFTETISELELKDEIKEESDIPSVKLNINLPPGRPSLEYPELVLNAKTSTTHNVLSYKVIYDDTPDAIRMNPSEQIYEGSAFYDPPITRGVTKSDQPYRYVLANNVIYDDVDGDTSNMRKLAQMDLLSRTLDWAFLNGHPLPPLGSEFYIHLSDETDGILADLELVIACFCRKRRYSKFLLPVPDFSYYNFSNTRRHSTTKPVMTWDTTKVDISNNSPTIPLKDRINKLYFKGALFSRYGLRQNMDKMQKYDIKNHGKVVIPRGDLLIDTYLLRTDIDKIQRPVSDMSNYKILLDIPGNAQWSTRLKFIALTGSYVVRIMLIEHKYDKKNNRWIYGDRLQDIWETFTDSYLPVTFVHTVFGEHFSGSSEDDILNNKARLKIYEKLGEIKRGLELNPTTAQKKVDMIKARVSSIDENMIFSYIYKLIMIQCKYYGFMN